MRLSFTVPGEPVAKGRPRAAVVSGKARMYTPAKTQGYEAQVKWFATQAMKSVDSAMSMVLAKHPVSLTVRAVFGIPKSWTKRRIAACLETPEFCVKRPDSDNVIKIIGDALNGIVWVDDSQVARIAFEKVYGSRPCVEVTVETLP